MSLLAVIVFPQFHCFALPGVGVPTSFALKLPTGYVDYNGLNFFIK